LQAPACRASGVSASDERRDRHLVRHRDDRALEVPMRAARRSPRRARRPAPASAAAPRRRRARPAPRSRAPASAPARRDRR
jgi:hypothetical protein